MKASLLRSAPLLAVLLAPSAAPAQQRQGGPYIGPTLRLLLSRSHRSTIESSPGLRPGAPAAERPLGALLALDRDASGTVRVGVLVEVSDRGEVEDLRARGGQVGAVVAMPGGTFMVSARLPISAVQDLGGSRRVVSIEAARTIRVANDSGIHSIHADEVRQRSGSTWTGAAGQGVIVGVYDTGLDFRHDDFLDGAGKTRLLGLWDQTVPGSAPSLSDGTPLYGNYCTRAEIQAAIDGAAGCSEKDVNGHGTHVTGTAAGDGSAAGTGGTAYQYAGVAPAADILVVKGGNGSFSDNQILDGLVWLSDRARALRQPAVVNLSLGGEGGPHDGTSSFERAIDALSRDSFVVVVAAGNDGANGDTYTPPGSTPPSSSVLPLIHGMGQLATGASDAYTVSIPSYTPADGSCNDYFQLDFWYPGADSLELTLERPDGTSLLAKRGQQTDSVAGTGDIYLDNGSTGPDPNNHDVGAIIQANDCGDAADAPGSGTWTLRVSAAHAESGRPFHFWLSYGGGVGAIGATGFDDRYVVASPGDANSVITVGAYATRMAWPSPAGHCPVTGFTGYTCFLQWEQIGDIARFSGAGPRADGVLKPEITAPGISVVSSLSRDATVTPNRITTDGVHWALEGTSMATPHVTGGVALMLQLDPSLDAAGVRQLLSNTAAHDAFTGHIYDAGGSPEDWWGYGKLNVKTALDVLLADPGAIASVLVSPHADTLVQGEKRQMTAHALNSIGQQVAAELTWASTNPAVASVDGAGRVSALETGTAYIVVTAGVKRDSAAVLVAPPATLAVSGGSAARSKPVYGPSGTRLPLLAVDLRVNGYEPVQLKRLGVQVTGTDSAATVLAVRDVNHDGAAAADEPVLASAPAMLRPGAPVTVELAFQSLTLEAHDSVSLVIALALSGTAPNGATFQATLVPQDTRTLGTLSQAADRVDGPTSAVTSTLATSSVLAPDEVFALSENPVRHGHVIFDFSERPTVAGVFTLAGRRVTDLLPRLDSDGRVDWDLTNDEGSRVAPGLYLVVFDVAGQVVRKKLMILGSAPGAQE